MVKDAEKNADSDKERRALAEAKNQAEGLAHKAEKDLEEHGDKIEEDDREAIKVLITEVREIAEGEDSEAINDKSAELTAAVMKMGEAIYKDAGAEGAGEDGADVPEASGDDDEDIVDAEFEDVDEDKS